MCRHTIHCRQCESWGADHCIDSDFPAYQMISLPQLCTEQHSQAGVSWVNLTLYNLLKKRLVLGLVFYLMRGWLYLVVSGVSDKQTALLLSLGPSRDSKQNLSPLDLAIWLLSFFSTSTNSGPEHSVPQHPDSMIYSVLQGWLHWQP